MTTVRGLPPARRRISGTTTSLVEEPWRSGKNISRRNVNRKSTERVVI